MTSSKTKTIGWLIVVLVIAIGSASALVIWNSHHNAYTYSNTYRAYIRKAHSYKEFTNCSKLNGASDMGQPNAGLVVCDQSTKPYNGDKPYALTWQAPADLKMDSTLQTREVSIAELPQDLKTIVESLYDSVTIANACHALPLPTPTMYMAGNSVAASTPINCTNHLWVKTANGWQEPTASLVLKCQDIQNNHIPRDIISKAQLSSYCVNSDNIQQQLPVPTL